MSIIMTQLSLNLQENRIRIHRVERTEEGTAHVRANAEKFRGNCKKLIQHWQNTGNIPLSDDSARSMLNLRNLAQRVRNLRESGIVVISEWNDSHEYKLYRLGCMCPAPRVDSTGCLIHDSSMKL